MARRVFPTKAIMRQAEHLHGCNCDACCLATPLAQKHTAGLSVSKAKATKKRNSKIYTELALMYERLTGKAAPVNSETYQKLMKQVRKYFTPLLVEQEKKGV